jgi:SfnB family sulfur acquisition oxidoreductase
MDARCATSKDQVRGGADMTDMTEVGTPAVRKRPFSQRRVPRLDDAAAIGAARELALIFAEGAAERDRDLVVPYRQVEDLGRTGLLAITIPESFGGSDVSPRTLAEVTRILAAADPNVAQIPHSHFVYINLLKVAGTPEQQRFFFNEVLTGGVLGRAESEPGSAGSVVDARLTRDEPGSFRLNGHKNYCTGAIFASWIPTLAKLDDGTAEGGEELIAFVDRNAAGVSVIDDWGGMGQRTTASGSVVFADVTVPAEHIIRRAKALDRPRGYGAFAQLLHSAVEVGIAGGVLSEAAAFVRSESRQPGIAHGYRAQDDPMLIQRFGELTVDVRAAEVALDAAAVAVGVVLSAPSPDAATEASLAVATAKVMGERAALAVTNAIFELGGPAASLQSLNLHRHWRNARTHTLNDPIRWKYHHLGRFTLLGISPPRHEQL